MTSTARLLNVKSTLSFSKIYTYILKKQTLSQYLTKKMLPQGFFEPEFLKCNLLTTKCNYQQLNAIWPNMIKWWTKHCSSIKKLKWSLKVFTKFSVSTFIFQEISLNFLGFPLSFKFPRFFLTFQVFPKFWEPWQ